MLPSRKIYLNPSSKKQSHNLPIQIKNKKAGGKGALSRGEKPPTRDGVLTKGEREQGSLHPQGVRFVPTVPSSPCSLPPASNQQSRQWYMSFSDLDGNKRVFEH